MLFFSEIIAPDFEGFCKQYKAPLKLKKNEAIEVKALVTPTVLTKLKKNYFMPETTVPQRDSRHRFYIRFKVDELGEAQDPPFPVRFYIEDLANPESKVSRSSEPRSGKDFIN